MGCYQKLERDSFTSFLLILCVRAYNCGFYGSVTQIEQNRESRLQKREDIETLESFFSAEEAEALISDNTISYKLHFAYYRTTGDIIGLRMKEKKKKKKK